MAIVARYIGYTRDSFNYGDEALLRIVREQLAPEIDVRFEGEGEIALLGGGTLINQSPWLIDAFEEALDNAAFGVVYGPGVGDPVFWGNHFDRWVPLLKRCKLVGVRGPLSQRCLLENGFLDPIQPCVDMIGDPYLVTESPIVCARSKRVAINIGSTNDSHWGGSDAEVATMVGQAALELAKTGWELMWFRMWKDDAPIIELAREIVTAAGLDAGQVWDAREDDRALLDQLAACEVVVAEKLHACAMAAVAGAPFVALEYQPKVRDFAASLGMENWTIKTNEVTAEGLVEQIEALAQEGESVASAMIDRLDKLRLRINAYADFIKILAKEVCG